jgi:hypothetical protein
MRRDREQVDSKCSHVDRQPARDRYGIGVKENASAAGDLSKLGDRLYGSHLVVRIHDRRKDGLGPERSLELHRVDSTLAVDRHQTRFESVFTQTVQSPQDGAMLDGGGHDVRGTREPSHRAEYRQIIRFGSAGCEQDLGTSGADRRGHAVARGVQRGARPPSLEMQGAWIKISLVGGRAHRIRDLVAHRRRGRVVQINSM